jgi:hypothetical protein
MVTEPNPVAEAVVRPLFALPAWLAGLINAVPDWVIAGTFLVTWIRPSVLGGEMVDRLELVMLLEFVVVHSTGFMGVVVLSRVDRRAKLIGLLALGGFYSIFTGGISMGFHTVWPFLWFWALTANRMLGVLISPAADLREAKVLAAGWASAVVAYVSLALVTMTLPIPRLGLTKDVVYSLDLTGSGLWVDQPWRVLAFGTLYFLITGITDLVLARKAAARSPVQGFATPRMPA